jgi:glutathione S-transferase
MQSSKPQLGYWKIRGLGQQIRYLHAYLGVDFEDVLYECGDAPTFNRDCWFSVKQSFGFDFPNLPYYIDGDVKMTETVAIMKYICHKHDKALLGRTPAELAIVEMISGIVRDFQGAITGSCYGSSDVAAIKSIIDSRLPAIQKFLGSKKFLVGDNVTYVDFIFFAVLHLADSVTNGYVLKDNLATYEARVRSLRGVKAFAESDFTKSLAFNNKMAKLGATAGHAASMQSDVKLTYFGIGGRAEAIRMCLFLGGVKFEDIRISQEEFGALKASGKLPAGQVPVIQAGNMTMTQSNAMLRYFGKRGGLYGDTPIQKFWSDWSLDTFDDFFKPPVFMPLFGATSDEEHKKLLGEKFNAYCKSLETRLNESGTPYLTGNKLTIGDLKNYYTFSHIVHNSNSPNKGAVEVMRNAVPSYPKLGEWIKLMDHDLLPYFSAFPKTAIF